MHRTPEIFFMTEKNTGNPQLEERLMKAAKPVIASNGITYLKIRLVEPHSTQGGRKIERKKGWENKSRTVRNKNYAPFEQSIPRYTSDIEINVIGQVIFL